MSVDLDTNDVVYYASATSAQNTATVFAVLASDGTTAGRPALAYQGPSDGEITLGIHTTTGRMGAGSYGPGGSMEIEDDTALVTGRFYRMCTRSSCLWPSASSHEFDLYDPVADRSYNNTSSADVDSPAATDVNIGAVYSGGWTTYNWDGKIAEVAVWPGVILNDAEVANLMVGVCPLFVRPSALGFYHPLTWLGQDTISGLDYATNATPTIVSQHPTVYYPSVPFVSTPSAGTTDVSLTAGSDSLSLTGQTATVTATTGSIDVSVTAGSDSVSLSGQTALFADYSSGGVVPYNAAKKWVVDTFDLDTDSFAVALLTGSYTPSATHDTWSDVSGFESSGYSQIQLSSLSVSADGRFAMWDATDLSFGPSITTRAAYLVIVQGTAGALNSGDKLFGYAPLRYDQSELTISGDSLAVAWSTNGIWRAG